MWRASSTNYEMEDSRRRLRLVRLHTSDGKTKDRVEDWRKNIELLNSDLLKQVSFLSLQLDILQNFQASNNAQEGTPQMEKK